MPMSPPRCPYPGCKGTVVEGPQSAVECSQSRGVHALLKEYSELVPLRLLDDGALWPVGRTSVAARCPRCKQGFSFRPSEGGKAVRHEESVAKTGAPETCGGEVTDPGVVPPRCPAARCRAPLESGDLQPRCLYCGTLFARCPSCQSVNHASGRSCRHCGQRFHDAGDRPVSKAWTQRLGCLAAFQSPLLPAQEAGALLGSTWAEGFAWRDRLAFFVSQTHPPRTWIVTARRGTAEGEPTWVGRAAPLRPEAAIVDSDSWGPLAIAVTTRAVYVEPLHSGEEDARERTALPVRGAQGVEWTGAAIAGRDEVTVQLALLGADPTAGQTSIWCVLLDRWGCPVDRDAWRIPVPRGETWGPVWLPGDRVWIARRKGDRLVSQTCRAFASRTEWEEDPRAGHPLEGIEVAGRPFAIEDSSVLAWNTVAGEAGGVLAWSQERGWQTAEYAHVERGRVPPAWRGSFGDSAVVLRRRSDAIDRLPIVAWQIGSSGLERAIPQEHLDRIECLSLVDDPLAGPNVWAWLERRSGEALEVRAAEVAGRTLGKGAKLTETVHGRFTGGAAQEGGAFFLLMENGQGLDLAEIRPSRAAYLNVLKSERQGSGGPR